ncbi:hypothetical protein CUJ84_pRLN3000299 (plasmid) [Rhizobium leguminosarum]|uniref:Uncharacterized protein n=1 Tax=Rhizobium leguminosarum TaxID=384 RepID=A0A2K9ZGR1_RHILE|nr:hypothetical protein CUJ84_pRLN3000299 [Rhizobium leguminosarum]
MAVADGIANFLPAVSGLSLTGSSQIARSLDLYEQPCRYFINMDAVTLAMWIRGGMASLARWKIGVCKSTPHEMKAASRTA